MKVVITGAQAKVQSGENVLEDMPFSHSELETKPWESRKSKGQRCREKMNATARLSQQAEPEPETGRGWNLPSNISQLQKQDNSQRAFLRK